MMHRADRNGASARRNGRIARVFGASCLTLASSVALAVPPTAATIARHGDGHGTPACASCHGVRGEGMASAGFPRLAGLNAAYIEHQLQSFANGTRRSSVMEPIAMGLSQSERRGLATYYSQLPAASTTPQAEASGGDILGKNLALHGRWRQQVPGCDACHGPHGVGVGANFPSLAGQSAQYIANQLRAFKSGARRNDPLGLMRHVASALTARDIQAVSAWYAAQSLRPKEATP